MDKIRSLIKDFLIREYLNKGRIISFQELQNILSYAGFHYYFDDKGRKKLRIGKKIYPIYLYHKRNIKKYLQRREDAIKILQFAMNSNVSATEYKQLYDVLKHHLSPSDRQFFKKKKSA